MAIYFAFGFCICMKPKSNISFYFSQVCNPYQRDNSFSVKKNNSYITPTKDTCSFKGKLVDFRQLPSSEISRIVNDTVKKNELLGRGAEGNVYKIPNTDYCVKIPHVETGFWSWTSDVTTQDKLNHIVAKSANGAVIMNYIDGKSLPMKNKPNTLYSLPVDSYRKFLVQLAEAHNAGLDCDVASSNTIFNPQTHSIVQIDFRIPEDNFEEPNQYLVKAFSLLQQWGSDSMSCKQNQKLFLNLTQATLEELRPNKDSQILLKDVDFQSFYRKFQRTMFASGVSLPRQYDFLNKTMNEAITLKYRCAKSFDKSDIDLLTAKVNFAQSLINQLGADKKDMYSLNLPVL